MSEVAEYLFLEAEIDVVKGHVSREEAAEAVCRETGWPSKSNPFDRFTIKHAYARFTPVCPAMIGFVGYDMQFNFCKRGLGAFPVTIVGPCIDKVAEQAAQRREGESDD